MAAMTSLDRNMYEYAAVPLGGYNCYLSLAANVAKRVAIPAGAVAVLFSAQDHFVVQQGDVTVTVAWPGDTSDGSGPDLNPTIRRLDGSAAYISVMMATAGIVQLKFLKAAV